MRAIVKVMPLLLLGVQCLHAQRSISPLIIVDGVVVGEACETPPAGTRIRANGGDVSRIAGLNHEDIENVEVLKGVAAAQLYGPAAANGVIVVATKKGRHYCFDSSPSMSLDDPIAAQFFSPSFIMEHQRDIALLDTQRAFIVTEMQLSQESFLPMEGRLNTESEQLRKLLQPSNVSETSVLSQIDRVLAAEREIKRAQIGLLVRIKNALTPQQQARLAELRKTTAK